MMDTSTSGVLEVDDIKDTEMKQKSPKGILSSCEENSQVQTESW